MEDEFILQFVAVGPLAEEVPEPTAPRCFHKDDMQRDIEQRRADSVISSALGLVQPVPIHVVAPKQGATCNDDNLHEVVVRHHRMSACTV